jgi:hypothetical protein
MMNRASFRVRSFGSSACLSTGLWTCACVYKRVADRRSRDGQSGIAQDVAAVGFFHGWPPIVQNQNCASASWR